MYGKIILSKNKTSNAIETVLLADKLLKNNDNSVLSFIRYEVGEGIEVEKKDFAEEVQAQLGN